MKENTIYFAKNEFYQLIRDIGGVWNDAKERPIVCLLKLSEDERFYWAIPLGNWKHRSEAQKKRIHKFLQMPAKKIESCYYHLGRTTTQSIFFISDVVPICEEYVNAEYLGYDGNEYVIKNPKLIAELTRKLKRILYYEEKNPNSFRQHITDIKNYLIEKNNS